MRYLRMLSNSLVAAMLGTAYVLALVLHLNPALPLDPAHLGALSATVGLYYVFHLTVVGYVLLVLRQLFAREVFSPAWVSVDVLGWMSALAAVAGSVLMRRNLWTFAIVLDGATAERWTAVRSRSRWQPGCARCWRSCGGGCRMPVAPGRSCSSW